MLHYTLEVNIDRSSPALYSGGFSIILSKTDLDVFYSHPIL